MNMNVLLLSDIHANLTALEAVLDDAGSFDAVWFLGDLVGYGPDPNKCIQRVRSLSNLTALVGNHDMATMGKIEIDTFNYEARRAIRWTQKKISSKNLDFLRGLPTDVEKDDITLAHGSPRQPVWEYIINTRTAWENFDYLSTLHAFVGHSHLPTVFQTGSDDSRVNLIIPEENQTIELKDRMIINPGSVGQPRDRNPKSAYALFDSEQKTIEFRRVEYDIAAVQKRMEKADLPRRHIDRLSAGW
jgi:predicted phosphodiesterase